MRSSSSFEPDTWPEPLPEGSDEGLELLRCSDLLRDQERPAEAFALLESGADLYPQSAAFHTLRARRMCELGYYTEALAVLLMALNLDATCEAAYFWQGYVLFSLQREGEALAALDTLLALNPMFPDAAWLRAAVLRRDREETDPEVLAAYDLVLRLDPTNLYAQVERGDLLRACGRYEEAREGFARLLTPEACPDESLRVEATFKFGCVAMVLQENQTAWNAFRAVQEIVPDYPDIQAMIDLIA